MFYVGCRADRLCMYSVCNQILFYFIVEDFVASVYLYGYHGSILESPGSEFVSYKITRPKSCNKRTHFLFFLASRVVESNLQGVWGVWTIRVGSLKGEGVLPVPDNVPCRPNAIPPRHHSSTLRNQIQKKSPMSQNVGQSWLILDTHSFKLQYYQYYQNQFPTILHRKLSGTDSIWTPLSSLGGVVDDQTKTRLVAIDSAGESTILD